MDKLSNIPALSNNTFMHLTVSLYIKVDLSDFQISNVLKTENETRNNWPLHLSCS